ncbi:hypothetical protein AAVH_12917 [Aphelenchoides avenae]|nr:hypothetical protein AAVH_12917 [Aphelenchus avenae]
MVDSFTDAVKVTDVPGLDFIPRPLLTSFTIANYSIFEGSNNRREVRLSMEENYDVEHVPGKLDLESTEMTGFLQEWSSSLARCVVRIAAITIHRAKPWNNIDATFHELNQLYTWPQLGHVSVFFYIGFDFPLFLNFSDPRATRRYEDRILRRFWSVLSASRTFLRCADKRIKWNVALVAKLHRVPAGEAAEQLADRLLQVLPRLVRIPGDNFGDNYERTIMDDSYAHRLPESYAQNHHKLRQRLILSANSSAHTFIYEEDASATREEQYRNALRYQNTYGT